MESTNFYTLGIGGGPERDFWNIGIKVHHLYSLAAEHSLRMSPWAIP